MQCREIESGLVRAGTGSVQFVGHVLALEAGLAEFVGRGGQTPFGVLACGRLVRNRCLGRAQLPDQRVVVVEQLGDLRAVQHEIRFELAHAVQRCVVPLSLANRFAVERGHGLLESLDIALERTRPDGLLGMKSCLLIAL